jgi:tetratricopeptide (TPR) repeat protein
VIPVLFILQFVAGGQYAAALRTGPDKVVLSLFQQAYKYRCREDGEKSRQVIQKLQAKYPQYHPSTLLGTFEDKDFEVNVGKVIAGPAPLAADESDEAKLGYVGALIFSRSENLDLMKSLLNFKGHDETAEAYRLALESYIASLKGNSQTNRDSQIRDSQIDRDSLIAVLDRAPILSTLNVVSVFYLNGAERSMEETLEKAKKILELKVESSVNPAFTQDALKYLRSGADPSSQIRDELLESAYKACPSDLALTDLYLPVLIRNKNYTEAYPILKKIVLERRFPTAGSEFLFAQVLYGMGEYDRAKHYYKKTASPHNIFATEQQKETATRTLASIDKSQSPINSPSDSSTQSSLVFLFVALPLALISFVVVGKLRARRV